MYQAQQLRSGLSFPTTMWKFRLNRPLSFLSNSSDDYQYLEKSILPTMHFQPSLPRLPIPKLEKSCERYLKSVEPIVSAEQLSKTAKLVADFRTKEGIMLHKELVNVDKKNKHTSYISEFWYDMYLKDRVPIVANYNPALAYAFDPDTKYNDQATRATNLVISALRFKRSLDAGILNPEVFHLNPKKTDTRRFRLICRSLPSIISFYGAAMQNAYPLDMSQHPSLFNTTRIPALGRDQLFRDPSAGHLVVLRKGHFFAVRVFRDGAIIAPQELFACLKHILNLPLEDSKHPLAFFTTLERNRWASLRSELLQAGNEDALKLVDSALFAVCLDDLKSQDPKILVDSLLLGTGANRWFDKSFSLIVHGDGLAAINFEHSWGDGVAVLRLVEDTFKDSIKHHFVTPETSISNVVTDDFVRKIEFKLTPSLEAAIQDARHKFITLKDSLSFTTLEYFGQNRDSIKQGKVSPDAVMQLAIQLAFYRMYGKFVATYESCSTAVYRKGRTETMRPCTMATKRFVEAFYAKHKMDNVALRGMLELCSSTHFNLVKEASMGQGFDRHLFALRKLAERTNPNHLPAIFADEVYRTANHYTLSTSTLSTDTVMLGGFAPVVPDGFGIGYNVGSQRMGAVVSAYKANRNDAQFVDCLKSALDSLKPIVEHKTQLQK